MIDFLLACVIIVMAYVHICFHMKTSNELEVYDLRKPNKEVFDEICDYRQPVKVHMGNELSKVTDLFMGAIFIRNVTQDPSFVSVDIETANRIFEQDKQSRYISERNTKKDDCADVFLRPHLCAFRYYDYMRGSEGAVTPFKYDLYYRHFLYVSDGTVCVRVATPNTSEMLHMVKDSELFEFRAYDDPWKENTSFRTKELTLSKGDLLYIPAYWWYSIKYTQKGRIVAFKYHTYASACSIFPKLL